MQDSTKFPQIIFLLILYATHAHSTPHENGLKINTDLTSGIIGDVSAENSKRILGDSINSLPSAANSSQISSANAVANNVTSSSLEDKHICTREEEYVEQVRTPSIQPVKIRTSTWCMEFPPRCSNYKTEMREIVKVENVTKTRTIRFCCAGYEGNISINDTVCKPVCRSGCGRGYCMKPDVCSCEPGYMGKHCTQRCDHDHWGLHCQNQCQCHNGAACDNKSGTCHCTIGWTGEFCEHPCPLGTHGVMCRKACECENKLCHPQTGACHLPAGTAALAPNVTHVMIATLNSTIVNITHNLDRIAKNIVNIASSTTTENSNSPTPMTTTTVKPHVPEVIVIKQEEPAHTPKIIVHQPGQGILENIHTAAKSPEVIHLITGWPGQQHNATHEEKLNLAGFGLHPSNSAESSSSSNEHHSSDHDNGLLTTLLVILLIIMLAIGMGFLYVYRRYHLQKAQVEAALAARNVSLVPGSTAPIIITPPPIPPHSNDQHLQDLTAGLGTGGSLGKSFLKPLPDLPAFTQMVRNKIEVLHLPPLGPDLYDSPSNTSSLNSQTPTPSPTPYAYARKESLYSVVSPKSRKGSMDSHLYDEIRYPTAHMHQHPHSGHRHSTSHNVYIAQQQQQQQHQQHQHQQHFASMQHHQQQQLLHQQNSLAVALNNLPPKPQQQYPQHQTQPQQQQHLLHGPTPTTGTHISHLIIPPQNTKFLQVPPVTHTSHKVAHI